METLITPAPDPTPTQKGSIGEAIVGAQLMLASAGRLSPYRPLADDHGTDLLVVDKITGRVVHVQVKANYSREAAPPRFVQFDVQLTTFRARVDAFVLAAILDPANGALWRAWLIPAMELTAISTVSPHKLAITPNPSLTSNDRYAPWRCQNARDLVDRLMRPN